MSSPAGRQVLLRLGFSLVALGVGLLALVSAMSSVSMWLALPFWCLAGTGMGLSMPVISVLMLAQSPDHEQGANSAALQICDVTASVVTIGAGGALVAWAERGNASLGGVVAAIDLTMAGIAAAGILAAGRTRSGGVAQ